MVTFTVSSYGWFDGRGVPGTSWITNARGVEGMILVDIGGMRGISWLYILDQLVVLLAVASEAKRKGSCGVY